MTERIVFTEFKLRVTPAMRLQIEEAAKDNSRTLNAEIVARLAWSFEHDSRGLESVASVLRVASPAPPVQHLSDEIEILRAQIRHEGMLRQALEQRLNAIENQLAAGDHK